MREIARGAVALGHEPRRQGHHLVTHPEGHRRGDDLRKGDADFAAIKKAFARARYKGPLTAEMITFSRLPKLVLPDMAMARDTAKKMGLDIEFVKSDKDILEQAKLKPMLIILDLNFAALQP